MFIDEKAAGEKEPSKVGTLRLSTAMRIGAKIRPQCRNAYFYGGASCAMGAAVEGRFGQFSIGNMANLAFEMRVPRELIAEVIRRNDFVGQTREQIADWLEQQGY